jgi:uridine phosphorylase
MMGAPYATALMETLIAWGARTLLFFGWCGAISPDLRIGDVVIPTGAVIDEGTSLHYGGETGRISEASADAREQALQFLSDNDIPHRKGPVWSTDAPFRETPGKVAAARDLGACAVEMETSALFTVGRYRKVSVGAILVVSDDLSSMTWKPGFKDGRFRASRRAICEGIAGACRG